MTCPKCKQLATKRELREFAYGEALRKLASTQDIPDEAGYKLARAVAEKAFRELDLTSSELMNHVATH